MSAYSSERRAVLTELKMELAITKYGRKLMEPSLPQFKATNLDQVVKQRRTTSSVSDGNGRLGRCKAVNDL